MNHISAKDGAIDQNLAASMALPVLPLELMHAVTDIVFHEPGTCDNPIDLQAANPLAFIGERHGYRLVDLSNIEDEDSPEAAANMERLTWVWNLYKNLLKDRPEDRLFRYEHEGRVFRCKRRTEAFGARRLTMRHTPVKAPLLEELQHPAYWHELMMMPSLLRGGLVILCAPTGNGKTTTLAGMWSSRLRKFAGVGVTCEEPVEIRMDGFHGKGICVQTEVDMTLPKGERFPTALEDILTEFPTLASGGGMLLIGELRDAAAAKEALMYAQTGIMVACTVHADNPPDAVQRVITLAAGKDGLGDDKAARELVAANLRLVIQQRLVLDPHQQGWKRGTYTGDILFSANARSTAAGIIRDQPIVGLNDVVEKQANVLRESARQKRDFSAVYELLGGEDNLEI